MVVTFKTCQKQSKVGNVTDEKKIAFLPLSFLHLKRQKAYLLLHQFNPSQFDVLKAPFLFSSLLCSKKLSFLKPVFCSVVFLTPILYLLSFSTVEQKKSSHQGPQQHLIRMYMSCFMHEQGILHMVHLVDLIE